MKSCFKLSRNIKQQIPENLFSYKIFFPKKLCVHVKNCMKLFPSILMDVQLNTIIREISS